MRCKLSYGVFTLLLVLLQLAVLAKKQKSSVLTDIDEIKEYKKVLRTKTNVLILYLNNQKSSQSVIDVFKVVADNMKGQATLIIIDCSSSEGKKLCKKLKIGTEKPYYIKHYKDGEFHKDYKRSETISSMSNFLRDPSGDLPWDEDPAASDIYHLSDGEALSKFLKKGAAAYKKSMVMFYAPWCGFCKSMKPDYVAAAAELKGEALLAAIDMAQPGNSKLRQFYNITGFPTLYYYEKGQFRFAYNGENKHQAIVQFMRDPLSQMQPKKKVQDESWSEDSDVVHLNEQNFQAILSEAENALVVFYAPWCGHCKRIKPEFEKAATRIKTAKLNGLLAAVDATAEPGLASRYGVKGYPTLKYFSKGEFKFDAGHARQEDQIVSFITDPTEPPPPPPPEKPWSEEESPVRHLDTSTFKTVLKKVKHAIVMFYAPWCGHCKSTKPEFVRAAEKFASELMVLFGAVDCTVHSDVCAAHSVQGYPTFKYFSYYDKEIKDYTEGRKEANFVKFIHGQGYMSTEAKAEFGLDVTMLDDSTFQQYIAEDVNSFVMFYATWCGPCMAAKPQFSRAATALKGSKSLRLAAINGVESPRAADLSNVQKVPEFKMFRAGQVIAVYQGARSYDSFMSFCEDYKQVKDEL